jgi:hypothetical protein
MIYGGRFSYSVVNTPDITALVTGNIHVNNTTIVLLHDDFTGLPDNIPLKVSKNALKAGDDIHITNCIDLIFIPYKPIDYKNDYYMELMSNIFTNISNQVNSLQLKVDTMNAKMENKILSGTRIDIEAESQGSGYTVTANNGLGAKIYFTGIDALLVNTGQVKVNGEIVYDNTGLLGLELGGKSGSLDVMDGDLIESSGLSTIEIEYYIVN